MLFSRLFPKRENTMKTHALLLLSIIIVFTGCKNKTRTKESRQPSTSVDTVLSAMPFASSDYYFAGEYVLEGKKATLKECATGKTFPIVFGEVSYQLEKEYKEIHLPEGTPVYAQVYGYLVPGDDVEQTPDSKLVVTRLTSLNPEATCQDSRLLTGNYITYIPNNIKPSERFTFTLYPDHTYKFSILDIAANTTKEANGTWYLIKEDYIQFASNPLTNFRSEAFVNYDKMELIFKNSKRVYYREATE